MARENILSGSKIRKKIKPICINAFMFLKTNVSVMYSFKFVPFKNEYGENVQIRSVKFKDFFVVAIITTSYLK